MNYKDFTLGDWIGHISGVIEDETTLDGNEMRDLVEFLTTLNKEPCEDTMAIHTQGLDEGIRCAMCTNSMKSNRGCDGGCVVNEGMYREVMNTIEKHIVPPVTPTQRWIPCSERLPKPSEYVDDVAKYYLVQNEYGDMLVARYIHSGYWKQIYRMEPIADEIVAWMPLPEPYKAESEDKE